MIKLFIMKEKILIILLSGFGLMAVLYGMARENNVIFILGLIFVIGGYILIRKRLKKSIQEKR